MLSYRQRCDLGRLEQENSSVGLGWWMGAEGFVIYDVGAVAALPNAGPGAVICQTPLAQCLQ